jgi:hypothetical protein
MSSKKVKPWENAKWSSIGTEITDHPNKTYKYKSRTHFDLDTGTYKAHSTWGNHEAAQNREKSKVDGADYCYPKQDDRHKLSECHGPRMNQEPAKDRDKAKIKGRDFGYNTKENLHRDSKIAK